MKYFDESKGINGRHIDYIFIEDEDLTIDEAIEEFGDEYDLPDWMLKEIKNGEHKEMDKKVKTRRDIFKFWRKLWKKIKKVA